MTASRHPTRNAGKKSMLLNFPTEIQGQADTNDVLSHIPQEPNKGEAMTDWDLLAKLFPPLWASHAEDHREFPNCLPNHFSDNTDLPNVANTQNFAEESRCLPDMESIQKGFQDLGLLESWMSNTEECSPRMEDLLKDVYNENPVLQLSSALKQIEGPNKSMGDNLKYKNYVMNSGNNYCNAQKRVKEYSAQEKHGWKSDRGKGKSPKNNGAGQSHFSVSSRDDWSKEKYPKTYDYMKPPLTMKQSTYNYSQPFPKERGFPNAGPWKPYNDPPENRYNNFPAAGSFDCYENSTHRSFTKSPEFDSHVNSINHNENIHLSSMGPRWLDRDASKKATSSLPSPVNSTFSDGSPTHHSRQASYFSHVSPTGHASKDGSVQINGSSKMPAFSNFGENDQRPSNLFGNPSPKKDGGNRKMPPVFQPAWPHQQQSPVQNNTEKFHRPPKKHSPQNNGNPDKRGKRNWNVQAPQQYNGFPRKSDPSVGNISDFINASFLPSFSSVSDFKQNPNFPTLNPQAFSPPGNMTLPPPPPPFPFSDLIDLFHYEDLNHLNPFLSELLCGDLSPQYFAFPTPFNRYRPPRNRSGPANELHIQLEESCEQWRALEKERKKSEADLARNFPGSRVSSSYSSNIPKLPTNPSRVDRLIVDQLREHSRALSLLKIMEKIRGAALHVNITLALEHHLEAIHLTQARRKDEIVNAANRQKQGAPRYNNEKDVLALAAAIKEMVISTRKSRTALWCALQMTLVKSPSGVAARQEDVERALRELCPKHTLGADAVISKDIQDGKKESGQLHFQSPNE
ncbi:meiosis-specific coiled-coil domain-containing protein MEIOC isoform X4 [Xenopus laevis]|uniref:Meiosis-specific coiled-coil domain-containing protein MEIOC isoform X4 n=1 Tax=Xenopus laevis TaxID=8355 RepID=A0A8J1KZI7_XENLA|nr:meiosis-specific coiled-coil domain-containing protein MEIOC isoform X4 [Xenopus laevis]